jgi:2-polyprenyl-3-methyl-5-hydroxy-6-metoxy-1,4-benzoquinol methylase
MANYSYTADEREKIRQQFDHTPYPHIPLENTPREEYNELFIHNLVTPYYLYRHQVVDTRDKWILDVGCGSGFKSLILAEANPGAHIVGIDISQESVDLSQKRLAYHGFTQTEFHCLSIEDLPTLGKEFDYINCDETLYLLPDPIAGLQAMKSVLKPDGIIRSNLHHAYQRAPFYRAQELFRMMGLMEQSPTEFEEEMVFETMASLKDAVKLKAETWRKDLENGAGKSQERGWIGMNYLLHGDRGFTIPDLFSMLKATDLEFISMVDWHQWNVTELFHDPDNLPEFWQFSLAGASLQEQLRVFELLHPFQRLLDFWCTHPGEIDASLNGRKSQDWQQAIVHLHPQLRTEKTRQLLVRSIKASQRIEISKFLTRPAMAPVLLAPLQASCLLSLWEGSQPIEVLVERYHKVYPLDPVTLEPISAEQAFNTVKDLLSRLETHLYVLRDR